MASIMSLYHNSKHKIRNISRTIDGLLDGDFPHDSGKRALRKLQDVFSELDSKLDRAQRAKDVDSIRQLANNINLKVLQALPILGFILRSTNVRNAFELVDPLQVIADATLQGSPHLLLSSEWDYVPFAYPQSIEDLRSFVLIGLPASEAASALLVPLAGHELGHAVWRNRGIGGGAHATLQYRCEELYAKNLPEFKRLFPDYRPDDIVSKEILPEAIAQSVEYAVFQAEELFCDLFAYAIFGESYLFAFSYILAPGSGATRRSKYPSYKTRIKTLQEIAKSEGANLPDLDVLNFRTEIEASDPRARFILRMAETSVSEIITVLWGNVTKVLTNGKVRRPNPGYSSSHYSDFKNGVPAHQPVCLGDIINAGWTFCRELQSSREVSNKISEKLDQLNEVLLKSVEVMEFRRRTST